MGGSCGAHRGLGKVNHLPSGVGVRGVVKGQVNDDGGCRHKQVLVSREQELDLLVLTIALAWRARSRAGEGLWGRRKTGRRMVVRAEDEAGAA